MLSINDIRQATQKVGRKYGIKKAYLFGSYTKGYANDASDVDIMIEKGDLRGIGVSRFRLELIDELGGTDVDVVTENGLRKKFYDLIKNDRILMYGA